jgi:heat shock protein HtpX
MAMGSQGSTPPCSPSIAGRAVLAVALLIGFYVLALAIAGALLWLAYAMVAYGHRVPIKLLVLCVAGAVIILWSIVPRFDRFVAPGPRLLVRDHPRLFGELRSVAQATGQEMPAEVYLEGDVNAWVAQRGGIMGFGSRRVMGLGLSLMRVLSVSEFRAVLAHEFGHYHGGDTRLGPWIYKTRGAIGRTIAGLGNSALQKPFLAYGKVFLRITHAISRRQEFTADRLAASKVGAGPLITGLKKTHAAGMAYTPFWRHELVPVLAAGFRPPLADGFARFMESAPISAAVKEAIGKELEEPKSDPYDTHQPLGQRIAAVGDLPAGVATGDDPLAVSLLENLPALERQLLAAIAGAETAGKLKDAAWEEIGTVAFVPMWRKMVAESRTLVSGVRPETLYETVAAPLKGSVNISEQVQRRIAAVGAALTLAALDAGASLQCEVGVPVTVQHNSLSVETFSVVSRLMEGKLDPGVWRSECETLGISGVDLSSVASA